MFNAAEVIEAVRDGAQMALQPENAAALEAVGQEIIVLQEAALKLLKDKQSGKITAEAYDAEINRCSDQMKELEDRQAELQTADTRYAEVKTWLDTFKSAMERGDIASTDDVALMKTLVECIIVDDKKIEVQFKCGASIKQDYVK